MSARGIHQKDNMGDNRSTGGGDDRLKGRIQGFCLVRTVCYSPGSVGLEAPFNVAKRLKGAKRPFFTGPATTIG